MKKLFLIPLMTLMCSVMAWGTTKEVNTRDKLVAAVNEGGTANGDVIKLTANITLDDNLEMYYQNVTLDLNGYTLSCAGKFIDISDVQVTIMDGSAAQTGTITGTGYNCLKLAAYYVDPINVAPTKVILNSGKIISTKVKASTVNRENAAVCLYEGAELEMNGGRIESKNIALYVKGSFGMEPGAYGMMMRSKTIVWPAKATISGGELVSTGDECVGIEGNSGSDLGDKTSLPSTVNMTAGSITSNKHAVVVLGKTATFNLSGGSVTATNGYGIVGNGRVGNAGQVVNTPNSFVDYGGTVVTVSGGSVTSTNAAGIYQPQSGTVTISGGAVTGKTGLAIKSGSLNVTGGTITANGDKNVTETGINNGIIQTGAAISIESNGAYAGNMSINISDDAHLVSAEGYAIYEYVAKSGDETHVETIAVTGGTFEGGISVSQDLAAEGGFVSGGTWSEDVIAHVADGKATNAGAGTFTIEAATVATSFEGVNANSVVETSANQNITASKEVKKLTVDAGTVTIKDGAMLKVGKGAVLLKEGAKLVVEAGGTLLVDGLIYGANGDNVEIFTNEDNPATVLFSPETGFVKEDHPQATYKFHSKARYQGGKYIWQRFGIPTFDGKTTITWTGTTKTSLHRYDYTIDDWGNAIPKAADNRYEISDEPFQCYNMTVNEDTEVEYTFTGAMTGNTNAPLKFVNGWNYFANSYTAPISIENFMDEIADNYEGVSATVYVYKRNADGTTNWTGINAVDFILGAPDMTEILPMQAFILQLREGATAEGTISYKANVYDPAMSKAASAPARVAQAGTYNAASIEITDGVQTDKFSLLEGEGMSDGFDNKYDAEKNNKETNDFSIYCQLGSFTLSTLATNDLSDKFITFDTNKAGEFTLKVTAAVGETITLYDMEEKKSVALTTDNTYKFNATVGKNEKRFVINPKMTPTASENIEAAAIGTGKFIGQDGQLYIVREGNVYNVQGQAAK